MAILDILTYCWWPFKSCTTSDVRRPYLGVFFAERVPRDVLLPKLGITTDLLFSTVAERGSYIPILYLLCLLSRGMIQQNATNTTTSNALQCTLYTWFRQFKCAKLSFLRRQKPAMCVSVPFPGPSLNMTASISFSPGRIRLRQKCLKTTSPNPSKSFEYYLKTVVLTPKPQIIRGTISTISSIWLEEKTTPWKELEKHVVLFCNPQNIFHSPSLTNANFRLSRAELPSCCGIYRRFRQRFRCSGGYRIGSCERRVS